MHKAVIICLVMSALVEFAFGQRKFTQASASVDLTNYAYDTSTKGYAGLDTAVRTQGYNQLNTGANTHGYSSPNTGARRTTGGSPGGMDMFQWLAVDGGNDAFAMMFMCRINIFMCLSGGWN